MVATTSVNSDNVARYAADVLAMAATMPRATLTARAIRLPKLDVTAWFSDATLADACQSGLVRRDPRDETPGTPIEVFVLSAADGRWPAPAKWRESSFSPVHFDRVITGQQLRGYYHHDHRFWQFYDPLLRRGIQSMLAADRFPPWESSGPLRAFLHWAYEGLGMRLAHAATLGYQGRGVLLAGSGGSGKSGTTLAGILHGLNSVGDDYVLLDRSPSRCAYAVFSKMKQDLAGLERAGVSACQLGDAEPNWQDKIEFDPRWLADDAMSDRMEIEAILLPKIAHRARTTIEPARAADAMLALAPSGLFQMPGCAQSGVRFFAQFVRRTPAFHLLLSEDPAEIAETIQRFLTKEPLARAR